MLITGGASGIGLASAEACAREGATVVISDVNVEEGRRQAAGLRSRSLAVEFVQQDTTCEDDWRRVIDDVLRRHGRLEVLVNNAGIAVIAPIEQETLEGWRRTQAVNAEGVFLGVREAVRAMKAGGGSIINISSIEGIIGSPFSTDYNAKLTVLLQGPVSGQFSAPVDTFMRDLKGIDDAVIADLDGDRRPDAAVTAFFPVGSPSVVHARINRFTQSGAGAGALVSSGDLSINASRVTAGDVDGDGRNEVVVLGQEDRFLILD